MAELADIFQSDDESTNESNLDEVFASDEESAPEFFGFSEEEIIGPSSTSGENSDPSIASDDVPIADLPQFVVVNRIPTQAINGVSGEEFVGFVDNTYNAILKWRKNLFKLPSGNASKKFVTSLTEWIGHFNSDTALKGIALKVFHILPALLLQKPSRNSKAKEHLKCLERRLALWEAGDLTALLAEARVIQDRLKKTSNSTKRQSDDVARIFARHMLEGKVNAALKFLSEENGGGVHKVTDKIMEDLLKKTPKTGSDSRRLLAFWSCQLCPWQFL